MEYTLRVRVHVARSTKGQWTPDATVEVTTTREPGVGMSVSDILGDERRYAMEAIEASMDSLVIKYPHDASKV
jgi:hypothetical protein